MLSTKFNIRVFHFYKIDISFFFFDVGSSPLRRGPSWQRISKRDLSPFRPHPSPRVHDGRDRTLLRSSRQIPPQVCRRRERRGRSLLGLRSDGRKAGEKSCNWQGCSRGKGSCINDVTLSWTLGPPPPIVPPFSTKAYRLYVVVTKSVPSPVGYDVIYRQPLWTLLYELATII